MNGSDKGQRAEGKRQVKKKKRQEMVETVQESAVRSRGERRREGCGGGERDRMMICSHTTQCNCVSAKRKNKEDCGRRRRAMVKWWRERCA